jgi:hypothetical protein
MGSGRSSTAYTTVKMAALAKTDRQRQDRGHGKGAVLHEQSDARPEIAGKPQTEEITNARHDRPLRGTRKRGAFGVRQPDDDWLGIEKLVPDRCPVRDLTLNLGPGLLVGKPFADEGLVGVLELCGQLLHDFDLTVR